MKSFYLTNAIAYVNAPPHVGHALEAVQGDAITRYHRTMCDCSGSGPCDTRFLVGTDEHGTKIQQTAAEKGVTPQELADENAAHFVRLHEVFGCAQDDFIRTTSDLHKRGAQKLWKKIEAVDAEHFYEQEYEGNYCVGCEKFILEKDLVDGLCPNHNKAPELLKEKNIFFRLSKYSDAILKKVESGELEIRPASRRNEFLSLLKEGLTDVSFSRPKKTLGWGIEVPGHEDQVMYVWCDALSNYLTALGYADEDPKVEQYWPADVHLIGKDIIRFHCGIWIGMLMAAGLPIPKAVWVHGFITSEGQKMSKSLGNVVDPFEMVEQWGTDAVRYYLLREIPTGDDGDFSQERFAALYRDELQNTIGNLVRRVVAMTLKYFDGKVPEGNEEVAVALEVAEKQFHEGMQSFNIKSAVEAVVDLARYGNAYVEDNKPWELNKTDQDRLAVVLGNLVALCRKIGVLLQAIIPESAQKILDQVAEDSVIMGEPLFIEKQ